MAVRCAVEHSRRCMHGVGFEARKCAGWGGASAPLGPFLATEDANHHARAPLSSEKILSAHAMNMECVSGRARRCEAVPGVGPEWAACTQRTRKPAHAAGGAARRATRACLVVHIILPGDTNSNHRVVQTR